ncbi:hypothetical protein HanIR_Chr04g0159891 [Helianthus annuus]|nr:hypothetical protein HanIR_Chr04g0159891 [Helianthus annuus]
MFLFLTIKVYTCVNHNTLKNKHNNKGLHMCKSYYFKKTNITMKVYTCVNHNTLKK